MQKPDDTLSEIKSTFSLGKKAWGYLKRWWPMILPILQYVIGYFRGLSPDILVSLTGAWLFLAFVLAIVLSDRKNLGLVSGGISRTEKTFKIQVGDYAEFDHPGYGSCKMEIADIVNVGKIQSPYFSQNDDTWAARVKFSTVLGLYFPYSGDGRSVDRFSQHSVGDYTIPCCEEEHGAALVGFQSGRGAFSFSRLNVTHINRTRQEVTLTLVLVS